VGDCVFVPDLDTNRFYIFSSLEGTEHIFVGGIITNRYHKVRLMDFTLHPLLYKEAFIGVNGFYFNDFFSASDLRRLVGEDFFSVQKIIY